MPRGPLAWWCAVGFLTLAALALRLFLFIGYQGFDDRTYISYAWFFTQGGDFAAAGIRDNWIGRVGAWMPLAASLQLFGSSEASLAIPSLIGSTGCTLLTAVMGRAFFGAAAGLGAAFLYVFFPLDLLYSTRMYPDLSIALLSTLAWYLFVRGARNGRRRTLLAAGLAIGAAYLVKETAVILGIPALWWWLRRQRRGVVWALAPVIAGFAMCLAAETAFWKARTGDLLYRYRGLLTRQATLSALPAAEARTWFPQPLPTERFRAENTFLDAALMYATNEEFGLLFLMAIPLAVQAIRRARDEHGLGLLFLSVSLVLLFVPLQWPFTIPRDPRYHSVVAPAAVLLVVRWLWELDRRRRAAAVAVLVLSWLPCIYAGYASSRIATKRAVARYVAAHPGEQFWLSNPSAADAILLNRFRADLRIGVHRILEPPTPRPFLSNFLRCLRPEAPTAAEAPAIRSGRVVFVRVGEPRAVAESLTKRLPAGWRAIDVLADENGAPGFLPEGLRRRLSPARAEVAVVFAAGR